MVALSHMRWVGRLGLVAMVAGGVGCSTTWHRPPDELMADVPPAWSTMAGQAGRAAGAEPARRHQWWLRFDDPTLSTLIGQAMQHNTSIQGAVATLRQARALREGVAAALWPTLGSSASVRSSQSGVGASGRASSTYQAGLDASWELDVFGARGSALQASDAVALASQASLADVQVSIAAEVALDYILLRTIEARQAVARQNLASQQETLQIAQWRLQAGLVSSLDAEQARAAAAQTSTLLPTLQTSRAQTQHALAVLLGRPPAALQALLQAPASIPASSLPINPGWPAETLRQRADVRAAEHQVSAAWARVDQAQAARLPHFSLGGSLGLSAATLGALTHGASVASSLLGSVTLPLLDGGALGAQVDAQRAGYDIAVQAYRAAVLGALQEVEDALVALQGDRLKLGHWRLAADAASGAAYMAQQQYNSGLVDFQVVLQTQRTQLATQDTLASATADVASDQVRLVKALGGGGS
jgi:outer membrane protein, multidrug efflux system